MDINMTLAQIAHELRTPLTLIHSTLQLIEANLPQTKELPYWAQLDEDIQDMSDLLTNLTTGKSKEETTDIIQILQMLQDGFLRTPLGTRANIQITVSPEAKSIARHFPCNHIHIREICTNLMKNALEAMNTQSQKELRISLFLGEALIPNETDFCPQNWFYINICDNGPGIPPYILSRLYTPFLSGKSDGTGIGLSIVQNIIKEHGGALDVETSESGTSFLVGLPINTSTTISYGTETTYQTYARS